MESNVVLDEVSGALEAFGKGVDGSLVEGHKDSVFEGGMKTGEEEEGLAGRIGLVNKEDDGRKEEAANPDSEKESDVDRKRKVQWSSGGEEGRKRRRRKLRRRALSDCSSVSSADEVVLPNMADMSEDEQQFCLRWNNFSTNITSQFGTLRDDEDFVDVTLACGGMQVKAHRVVLSACSPYFKRMFKSVPYCQHPVVFLEGVHPNHLLSLLAFMYCGEVGVRRGQLPSLLSTAHALQIRGLTEMSNSANSGDEEENVILSSKRQTSAVERVLKDIGLSNMEKSSGGDCLQRSVEHRAAKRNAGGAESPLVAQQGHSEAHDGPGADDKDDNVELECSKESLGASQAPLASAAQEVPTDTTDRQFVSSKGPSLTEGTPTVNSPESSALCDMAANLVDVRIESPTEGHSRRAAEKREPQTMDGEGLHGHGWDPGDARRSPSIDNFSLITPKEEDVSLTSVVEPKMEFVEGMSEEKLSNDVPSISLTSQHKFGPHTLGNSMLTTTGVMQPHSPHLYFLPPSAPLLSPGTDGGRGHLKWEMPRPCPVCRRIYSNNSNLRRHLRTIHEDYYEKYVQ